MKLCVQTAPLDDYFGVDKAFQMIKEAGFDSVDYNIDHFLSYSDISNGVIAPLYSQGDEAVYNALMDYTRPYKEAADKYGISFNQMHTPFPTYVADKPSDDMVMSSIKGCIRVAGQIGCKYVIVHPAFLSYEKQLSPQDEWDVNIARYSELIPYARENNVVVCLENMFTGYKGKIYAACCAEMSMANRYIDALNEIAGEKLFGFCLDVGHALLVGKEIYNAIMEIGPNLVALHTHDNDGKNDQHIAPYMGVMDWDRFVKGLRDAGYRNALSFETFNAIQVVDKELAQPVLNYIAAAGKMFIKRIEA